MALSQSASRSRKSSTGRRTAARRARIPGVKTTILVLAAIVGWSATSLAQAGPAPPSSKLRFDVSFIPQAHDGPITGRVCVMVTRTVDKVPDKRPTSWSVY